jgi:metal-responsive CopG/Arc/MetJ family transcriptional regulator
MKHNISITVDAKLFRELETIRGREKRSTFIEHLILMGLKNYKTKKEEITTNQRHTPATLIPPLSLIRTEQ